MLLLLRVAPLELVSFRGKLQGAPFKTSRRIAVVEYHWGSSEAVKMRWELFAATVACHRKLSKIVRTGYHTYPVRSTAGGACVCVCVFVVVS